MATIRKDTNNATKGEEAGGASLAGRVALVTGGSRGIGRAIARRLAGLGASVAICGRDKKALDSTAAALKKLTGGVLAHTADVSRAADVKELVSKTESTLGPIAILVNNAGIGLFGPIQEKSE